jgi:hypothetical protein
LAERPGWHKDPSPLWDREGVGSGGGGRGEGGGSGEGGYEGEGGSGGSGGEDGGGRVDGGSDERDIPKCPELWSYSLSALGSWLLPCYC